MSKKLPAHEVILQMLEAAHAVYSKEHPCVPPPRLADVLEEAQRTIAGVDCMLTCRAAFTILANMHLPKDYLADIGRRLRAMKRLPGIMNHPLTSKLYDELLAELPAPEETTNAS